MQGMNLGLRGYQLGTVSFQGESNVHAANLAIYTGFSKLR